MLLYSYLLDYQYATLTREYESNYLIYVYSIKPTYPYLYYCTRWIDDVLVLYCILHSLHSTLQYIKYYEYVWLRTYE